jgi:hypothetical protein
MSKKIHTTIPVAPFSFIERDSKQRKRKNLDPPKFRFKANPVPKTIKDPVMDQLRKSEKKRKDRIKARAIDMYHSASLPPRMEMWKNLTVGEKDKKDGAKVKKHVNVELTFRPKVNTNVPNFSELQNQFETKIAQKKRDYQPTE